MIYLLELESSDDDLSFIVLKQETQIPTNNNWKAVIKGIKNWSIIDGNGGNHAGDLYYDEQTQTAYFDTNAIFPNGTGLSFYAIGGIIL